MARTKARETQTPKLAWSHALTLLKGYVEKCYNVLLTGMPGIGKTALALLLGVVCKCQVIIFHPVVSDPTDFKGLPWIFKDANGKEHCVFVPFDQLKILVEAKSKVLVLLDDLGQAADAVQAACMQLLHGGNINGKKLSKHISFIACTNRKQDRAGVSGILEPVKSRFHGIFELVPEMNPFIDHMIAECNISPMLVAFLRRRPEWLTGGEQGWKPQADIVNQPCPRTIEHLSDTVNMQLPRDIKSVAYAGAVGQGMGNEWNAFQDLLLTMPDLDRVCNNPHGAEKPAAPDVMYAMLGALHSRMDRGNLDNIYTYLKLHFTIELQAVFHMDLEKYDPKLMKHPAYIRWAAAHGEMLTN